MTSGLTASNQGGSECAGGMDQRRLRVRPEVGRGGRCRRKCGYGRELGAGIGGTLAVEVKTASKVVTPPWLTVSKNRDRLGRVVGVVTEPLLPGRRLGGGVVRVAQRGSGAGPPVVIQSLSESLRREEEREKIGINTIGWRNSTSLYRGPSRFRDEE